ncbi:hypothetical protein EPUL_002752 [Erysiphe pulchra]|uniref:Uncharacterized protein n=1 Tax=Erysiphe pulchra TaxID=225359 RepID=A0A2S4PZC0_9PEZI|nr:hypothetical protein EPUL_002752 [Erysiphe pulchra]
MSHSQPLTRGLSSTKHRSYSSKALPLPPTLSSPNLELALGIHNPENGKPPPVPPKSDRPSTPNKNLNTVYQQPNFSQPPKSDEDTPGLSHSWSDSSVEGETDHLFDSNLKASYDHISNNSNSNNEVIAPKNADNSTVILSTSPSIESSRPIEASLLDSSTHSDLWLRRLARKTHDQAATESTLPLNHLHLDLDQRVENSLHDQQLQQQQCNHHHTDQAKTIQITEQHSSVGIEITPSIIYQESAFTTDLPVPLHSDLMGNKFAKLRSKNLGEFSTNSNHHEDTPKSYIHESRNKSTNLEKPKLHIPGTRNLLRPSPSSRTYVEKAPPLPRKSSSRRHIIPLPTNFSKPDSNSSTHTSFPSSGSTTRAPTILTPPSSETLVLQSESALNLPTQTQPDSRDGSVPEIKLHPCQLKSDIPHSSQNEIPTTNSPDQAWPLAVVKLAPAPEIVERMIIPGPPLNVLHFECYHDHRYLRKTRNQMCPIGCMMCHKKDTEIRWTCTWCFLCACADCTRSLTQTPNRNLRVCLEKLEPLPDK